MTNSAIEALYIFNHLHECILQHVYGGRPASPETLLSHYLSHQLPRPSVIYLPDVTPSTILFSVTYSNIILLSPVSAEIEPLFVLEFLHRVIDVLEDFLGAPLLANKIESAYDVVAQLLTEMCDAGTVSTTEPNALRDEVEVEGWVGKFLGGVGLSGQAPSLSSGSNLRQQLALQSAANGPAIPWRRANVRHTSNELYVDIVESLSVTLAPSGRPLAAFANGSILFTSKISGVPDLLLSLSASGGRLGMEKAIELPVFHPCVRLARWKERPGELSFVPPDGKFILAGYEVNLMPTELDAQSWANFRLQIPVSIQVAKSLGPTGSDFEVRLLLSQSFPGYSSSSLAAPARPTGSNRGSGRSTPTLFSGPSSSASSSSNPTTQNVVVTIPVPPSVHTMTNIKASRGEAYYSPADNLVEWRVSTKDAAIEGNATLRCTVAGPYGDETEVEVENDSEQAQDLDATSNGLAPPPNPYDYNEDEDGYQAATTSPAAKSSSARPAIRATTSYDTPTDRNERKIQANARLMPSSASVSFVVKGWLASGIKVDGLNIDTKRSRGLGEGVKPYKGVKYITVSKKGVETRC